MKSRHGALGITGCASGGDSCEYATFELGTGVGCCCTDNLGG